MKKLLILPLLSLVLLLVMCSTKSADRRYEMDGVYYSTGLITSDGNVWDYDDGAVPDGSPVTVMFHDNGTPSYIYDDVVMGVSIR